MMCKKKWRQFNPGFKIQRAPTTSRDNVKISGFTDLLELSL